MAQPGTRRWPAPLAWAIPDPFGNVAIPQAAVLSDKRRVYRAIFDAQIGVNDPDKLLIVLSMAGSVLNALAAAQAPAHESRLAIVFHDAALDGLLDEAHYETKFGVDNPNIKLLGELKAAGVELSSVDRIPISLT